MGILTDSYHDKTMRLFRICKSHADRVSHIIRLRNTVKIKILCYIQNSYSEHFISAVRSFIRSLLFCYCSLVDSGASLHHFNE